MRLSLAFVLSMALAQAAQQPESHVQHRQVRRNDTGEPQRIKKLPRGDKKADAGKKDKKNKDSTADVESSKRKDKKSKDTEVESENKKDSKKNIPVVESEKSKRKAEKKAEESEKSKRKAEKKANAEAKKPKKEKRSGDQKELKKKLKNSEQVEVKQDVFTIDLGDILGSSSINSAGSHNNESGSQKREKEHESKREQKKKEREGEGSETVEVEIVEQTPSEDIVTIEVVDEANTSPTITVEGGRHKHVGHGRKKGGRTQRGGGRGRGRGQKLQGHASGKSGKEEEEIVPFRNHHKRGGRNKAKTRGSGKLRNIGGDKKETKNKTKVKTTQRMGARGSAVYAGKSAKL